MANQYTTGQPRFSPGKLVLAGCSRLCSLNVGNMPGGLPELVVKWFEEGATIEEVRLRLLEMGVKVSNGAIGRHRKGHLHPAGVVSHGEAGQGEKKTDLEVLETIIGRGSQQVDSSSTRISAEQLLRAIELKHKLTEGSVFDAMYEAMKGSRTVDLDMPVPPADDPALDVDNGAVDES